MSHYDLLATINLPSAVWIQAASFYTNAKIIKKSRIKSKNKTKN
jgi:hypothetical protein